MRVRHWRGLRRFSSLAGAVLVSAALLAALGAGFGAIPALGPALDPGRGAWTSAAGGRPVTGQALRVPGLDHPASASFTADGIASITAADTHDLFLALGYVHAKYRLSEMDLERRLGEGRLAALAGPSDTGSDEFELRLGLPRTAQNQWAATAGATRAALEAYAAGVNDDIAEVRASGDWPAVFTLSGAYPGAWTPVDSLVIQGVLTQELDYTTSPLDRAVLQRSLGAASVNAWFPEIPANTGVINPSTPYDPGPYAKAPLTPLAPDAASSALGGTSVTAAVSAPEGLSLPPGAPRGGRGVVPPGDRVSAGDQRGTTREGESPDQVTQAASQVLAQVGQLPAGQVHEFPDSNAWAVNGPSVAGALLGGDPHLPQTLPSIWYEVALSAPGYQVAGASVPGVPGVLLGHNAHIAWSLTDTQDQAALYYAEQVRGDEYYWKGAWRTMATASYTIAVRGGSPVHLTVDITAHGPLLSAPANPGAVDADGNGSMTVPTAQAISVDWMGNVPSDDLTALLAINAAGDWAHFKAALSTWRAPTQNFTYADDDAAPGGLSGNIGVYAAGYYPQVAAGCQPWLPMPGGGSCDVTGVIPYSAIPQVYDPPAHVVATDNQRPVTAAYPYYVGTSDGFYDPGYRAAYAQASLSSLLASGKPVTAASVAGLQGSLTDSLAASIVPRLLAALGGTTLTARQQAAVALLRSWNDSMDEGSAAATVWWTFWTDYLRGVFQPWWNAGHVPASTDDDSLTASPDLFPLDEDLQAWTLGAGDSAVAAAAFRGPSGHGPAGAPAAMVTAFRSAVASLSSSPGGAPPSWTWGRVHSREFPALTQASGLGYGPRAAGGDEFTENAADGGMTATAGPSWRMVATLAGTGSLVSAEGVYPGGQSENPASPWYANLIPLWWDGHYLPLPVPGVAATGAGAVRWSLHG
ncbi:MAG TPA: penicillin acylase family protein [Trebonia sp.]|nr:penicillin acylase family protein [Trebonia sp.]